MKTADEIIQRTIEEVVTNSSSLSDFELVLIGFTTAIFLIAAAWVAYWKYHKRG